MFARGIQYKNIDILQSFKSIVYKTKSCRIIEKSRCMSTSQESDVLFEEVNNKGIITLNRPNKLNSLNFNISNSILHKLLEWENKVEMVVIQGKGRAFCAGGDAVSVTKPGPQNPKIAKDFFLKEYILNGIIGEYRVPYVALIDGITMGGGVGLSIHGAIRIATENTIFAMPETLLGLFPDVGVSHFLSKMPHELGQFLALTGYRLKSTDVVKAGIATHYTRSENITNILKDIIELKDPKINLPNYLSSKTDDLKNIEFSLAPYLKLIETCFSAPTVEEIFERLNNNGSDFAKHTLELLKRMSPISLKISNKLLKIDKNKTLQECLIIDYRLAAAAVEARVSTDFYEGVRALLVDKDLNPRWSPPTLEDVTDEMVDTAFKELPSDEELNFEKRVPELRKRLNAKL